MLDAQLDLLQQYLIVERGLSRNTLAAYMADLQRFSLFIQARGTDAVTTLERDDITAYLAARRQQGISARTTARELVSIRTLFRFLQEREGTATDPTAQIASPQPGRYLPHVLTQAEVERLLQAPDTSTFLGKRDAALLELLYATGLRASELVGLLVGDVSTMAGYLKVRGKGGKPTLTAISTKASGKKSAKAKATSSRSAKAAPKGGAVKLTGKAAARR